MTHEFIVNTENVNEYGYRILTDGIDTVQYMRNPVVLFGHVRGLSEPKRVVGRCVELKKQNNQLIAVVEFDKADEFAKEVAGKVERGFIRMASLYADVLETSTDTSLILQGQTLETVTACKLIEISIVDIGGNDNALKLSKNGQPIQLKKIKSKQQSNMSLETIALAMGLKEDAESTAIVKAYNSLKLAKEQAETKANGLETELKEIKNAEANSLIEKGVLLGLIHEDFKETIKGAFEADFSKEKAKLTKLIEDKEAETNQNETHQTVKEIVLGKGKSPKEITLTFDYLQKHDPEQLRKIRDEQPKEYARLAKEYGNGVRHKED